MLGMRSAGALLPARQCPSPPYLPGAIPLVPLPPFPPALLPHLRRRHATVAGAADAEVGGLAVAEKVLALALACNNRGQRARQAQQRRAGEGRWEGRVPGACSAGNTREQLVAMGKGETRAGHCVQQAWRQR